MAKNSKYSLFLVSIESPKESPSTEILRGYEHILLASHDFVFVATIIHDKDHTDNGDPRKPHLHAFLQVAMSCTLLQELKSLKEALKCEETQISIEASNNEFLGVQYLIHKNAPQKAQYSIDQVSTNNNELLFERINKDYVKPKTEEELMLDAIKESASLQQLAEKIGLSSANKFRATFNQIKAESKTDIESLYSRLRTAIEQTEKLKYQLKKLIGEYRANALMIDDIEEAEYVLELIEN